jgi:hypothetical protein
VPCSRAGLQCSPPACQQQRRRLSGGGSSCTLRNGSSLPLPCASALHPGPGLTPRLLAWRQLGLAAQAVPQQRQWPRQQPQRRPQQLLLLRQRPTPQRVEPAVTLVLTAARSQARPSKATAARRCHKLSKAPAASLVVSRRALLRLPTRVRQQLQLPLRPAVHCLCTCRWLWRWHMRRRGRG